MFEILLFILILLTLGMLSQSNPHTPPPKMSDREYRKMCRNEE